MSIHKHDNQTSLDAFPQNKTIAFDFPNLTGTRTETPVQLITTSGTGRVGFSIPSDFSSLVSAFCFCEIGAASAQIDRNIDLFSSYGGVGENDTTHTESNTTSLYDLSTFSSQWYNLDVASVLTNLEGGDIGGVRVLHNAIGGSLGYTFLQIVYTPT